jgi:hypothetical protein
VLYVQPAFETPHPHVRVIEVDFIAGRRCSIQGSAARDYSPRWPRRASQQSGLTVLIQFTAGDAKATMASIYDDRHDASMTANFAIREPLHSTPAAAGYHVTEVALLDAFAYYKAAYPRRAISSVYSTSASRASAVRCITAASSAIAPERLVFSNIYCI